MLSAHHFLLASKGDLRPSTPPTCALATIAQKAGAAVIAGALPLRDRQPGSVGLDEFLAQYHDQQVALIVAPLDAASGPDVGLCGLCDFSVNAAGACLRCALMTEEETPAIRRAVDEERLLDEIEQPFARLGD